MFQPLAFGVNLELAGEDMALVPAHTHVDSFDMFVNVSFFSCLKIIKKMNTSLTSLKDMTYLVTTALHWTGKRFDMRMDSNMVPFEVTF